MTAARPTPPWREGRDPRPSHATRDAIAIAALSCLVAVAGGFHPALNYTIGLAGGITAAVILYREHTS
jgi:hypothetical protein